MKFLLQDYHVAVRPLIRRFSDDEHLCRNVVSRRSKKLCILGTWLSSWSRLIRVRHPFCKMSLRTLFWRTCSFAIEVGAASTRSGAAYVKIDLMYSWYNVIFSSLLSVDLLHRNGYNDPNARLLLKILVSICLFIRRLGVKWNPRYFISVPQSILLPPSVIGPSGSCLILRVVKKSAWVLSELTVIFQSLK